MSLQLQELAGNATPGEISVGEEFDVHLHVEDTANGQAVFSGYADVTFNAAHLTVVGMVTYDSDYTSGRTGTIDNANGLIDELGASAGGLTPPTDTVIATIRVRAEDVGSSVIATNAGEALLSEITSYDPALSGDLRDDTTFGALTVTVVDDGDAGPGSDEPIDLRVELENGSAELRLGTFTDADGFVDLTDNAEGLTLDSQSGYFGVKDSNGLFIAINTTDGPLNFFGEAMPNDGILLHPSPGVASVLRRDFDTAGVFTMDALIVTDLADGGGNGVTLQVVHLSKGGTTVSVFDEAVSNGGSQTIEDRKVLVDAGDSIEFRILPEGADGNDDNHSHDATHFSLAARFTPRSERLPEPLLHYTFDTDGTDVSGNSLDATVSGDPVFETVDGLSVVTFNNPAGNSQATQYLTVPNHASLQALADRSFTVAVRYRSTDTSQNNGRLLGNTSFSSGSGIFHDYNRGESATSTSYVRSESTKLSSRPDSDATAHAETTDGDFHWAITTVDRSSQNASFFVDELLIGSRSSHELGSVSFDGVSIGRNTAAPTFAARATSVDDFRIYDRVLTHAQIVELSRGDQPGAVSGHKFADLNGNGIEDSISTTVDVPGSANPYLAGRPDGTEAQAGDDAPNESPIEVSVFGGALVRVSATGQASYNGSSANLVGPDGRTGFQRHAGGPELGIADLYAPTSSLVGVFLGPDVPGDSAPAALNFESIGLDYRSVTPDLHQPFFIGDGTAGESGLQDIVAPDGATRLFLGTMDGSEWNNNSGSFSATVTVSEPRLSGTTVFIDIDGNGQRDVGEPFAVTGNDDPNTPDVDETGLYRISDVPGGSHLLREEIPFGSRQTLPGPFASVTPQFFVNQAPSTEGFTFASRVVAHTTPEHGSPEAVLGVPDYVSGSPSASPAIVDFDTSVTLEFDRPFGDADGVDLRLFVTQLDPDEGVSLFASVDGINFDAIGVYSGPSGTTGQNKLISVDVDFAGHPLPVGTRYLRIDAESPGGSPFMIDLDAVGIRNADTAVDLGYQVTVRPDSDSEGLVFGTTDDTPDRSVDLVIDSYVKIASGTNGGPVLARDSLFGRSVADIGDLNGDGITDLAIGARSDDASGTNSGSIHIAFMNADGSIASSRRIRDGENNGPTVRNGAHFGTSISAIGDFNNDGVIDVAVGAPDEDAAFLLFLKSDGTVLDSVRIDANAPGAPQIADGDGFGASVAQIGDLNGDGITDLAVGAWNATVGGVNGAVHILFLNANGTVKATKTIGNMANGGPTLTNAAFGFSVANLGDVNGDGIVDLAVGSHNDNTGGSRRGAVYIVNLDNDGTAKRTTKIADGLNGGPMLSDVDLFGLSVAGIGDFDDDGVPDLAAGATLDDSNGAGNTGAVHVMLLNSDGSVKAATVIANGTPGAPPLVNNDVFGTAIAYVDINQDGRSELVVGTERDGPSETGAVYVLKLQDTEMPVVTVTIAADEVSEAAGAAATTATVSRNSDTSNALTVTLISSDTSEATAPASVTIPAGQSSAMVSIHAADDTIVDGTQTVTITATAAGHASGSDSLDVSDDNDEPATLTLSIAADEVGEAAGSAATTATVSRNTDTTNALVVTLMSSDTSEATVPTSVTIPAKEATFTFNIDAVDDTTVDDTQAVTITATATEHVNGTDTLDVTDNDVATLTLSIAADEVGEAAGSAATTATVSRNTETTNSLVVTLMSSDTGEATVPTSVTIPADKASVTFDVDAVDDTIVDVTQTVTITATAAGYVNGTDTLDVTNDDDDSVLRVTSFVPTATGVRVTFSESVDSSVLNLNGSSDADLVLTGSTLGLVAGSLVVSADGTNATFVKSGGPLEPDTYTLVLRSAADGWRAADDASLLDGDTNGTGGGDFSSQFSVAAAAADAVVVRVPDVVRGYGQSVDVPASGMGIPLTINRGTGVTGLDLKLVYDHNLLNVTSFTSTVPGAAAAFNADNGILTLSKGTELTDQAGPMVVGYFTAMIPDTAEYKGKHVLDIADLAVYDDAASPVELPVIDDDSIHVAAYFGDANGSRTYNSPDATLTQRLISQINNGLPAYPLADPTLITDITSNGRLQANDTTSIQRVITQIPVANVPPLPSGITPPAPSGADPKVSIPRNLSGAPGDTVTVPVNLEVTEAGGITISGADIALTYDATRFSVSNVTLGSLLAGFSQVPNTSTAGTILYTASSATGTSTLAFGTTGTLFTVDFTVLAGAANGPSSINLLASSGGTFSGIFDNDLNELVLSPVPTNEDSDSIDGLFTIGTGDPPRLSVAAENAAASEGDTGTTAFTFTVTRSGDTSAAVDVDWAVAGSGMSAADAADFGGTLPTGKVSFAATETAKTVTVDVTGDTILEPDEDFTVTLSNATAGATIDTATATGTIENDDSIIVSIARDDAVNLEGDTGITVFTFTVTRSGDTSAAVDVDWAVTGSGANPADAADFGGTMPTGMVSFAAAETTKTITVNVTGDTIQEPVEEGFTVTLSNATAGATIDTATEAGTIQDDDSNSEEIRIAVGEHRLLPDRAGQTLQLFISGGADLVGLNLQVQVADGGPEAEGSIDGPAVAAVDILTGTIFAQNNSGVTEDVDGEYPDADIVPQFEFIGTTTQSGSVTGDGLLATITIDTTGFNDAQDFDLKITGTANGDTTFPGSNVPIELTNGTISIVDAHVAGRHVFYNNSAWDGLTSEAGDQDDLAIATDKQALLPGQTASFSNYTSYSKGLNGVMVDIAGLAGSPTAADFQFRVGNNNSPTGWSLAPSPQSITVRPGAGVEGSDRVTIVWADNDYSSGEVEVGGIAGQWLQVVVLSSPATGLAVPDEFYFGNAVGESGNSTTEAKVDTTDEINARNNPRFFLNPAGVDFEYDYNRDKKVDTTDEIIARLNPTFFLTALKLITPDSSAATVADAPITLSSGKDSEGSSATRFSLSRAPKVASLQVAFSDEPPLLPQEEPVTVADAEPGLLPVNENGESAKDDLIGEHSPEQDTDAGRSLQFTLIDSAINSVVELV